MKKQILKLTLLVVVFLSASTLKAQDEEFEEYTKVGFYTIGIPGEDLFITINGSNGKLEWAPLLPEADRATQTWAIQDHVTPSGTGYVQITAIIPDFGNFTMGTSPDNIEGKNITLTFRAGDPISDATAENYGYDQFQRRKTTTNRGGNDALFIKVPGEGGSRFGVAPSASGDPVQFDGGAIDKLEFKFVKDIETASVNSFGLNAFIISNPVNNFLTVKGAISKVSKISLYSVLGNKVLSKAVNNVNGDINIDVNALSTGLYILEMTGENGERFTKKIVKQ